MVGRRWVVLTGLDAPIHYARLVETKLKATKKLQAFKNSYQLLHIKLPAFVAKLLTMCSFLLKHVKG